MTIAVSVVVKPSRLLMTMQAMLCAGVMVVGIVIGCGLVGELSLLARLACLVVAVTFAVDGLIRKVKHTYPCQLDIAGTGQIRLVRPAQSHDPTSIGNNSPHQRGLLVTLLPDSTIWPHFMVLRLRDDTGHVHALPVWPDSLPQASFRVLTVACRWIAAHRFAE